MQAGSATVLRLPCCYWVLPAALPEVPEEAPLRLALDDERVLAAPLPDGLDMSLGAPPLTLPDAPPEPEPLKFAEPLPVPAALPDALPPPAHPANASTTAADNKLIDIWRVITVSFLLLVMH